MGPDNRDIHGDRKYENMYIAIRLYINCTDSGIRSTTLLLDKVDNEVTKTCSKIKTIEVATCRLHVPKS